MYLPHTLPSNTTCELGVGMQLDGYRIPCRRSGRLDKPLPSGPEHVQFLCYQGVVAEFRDLFCALKGATRVHVLPGNLQANSFVVDTSGSKHRIAVDSMLYLDHHYDHQGRCIDTNQGLLRKLKTVTNMHVVQVVVQVFLDSLVGRMGSDQNARSKIEDPV